MTAAGDILNKPLSIGVHGRSKQAYERKSRFYR